MFFNGRAATGIRNGQWGRCESCILIILGHKTDSVASIWSITSKTPQANQNQKQNWILFWQPEIGSCDSLQLQDCWHSSAERKYNHNQKTLSSFLLSTPKMYWIAPCTSLHLNLGDQTAHGIITVDARGWQAESGTAAVEQTCPNCKWIRPPWRKKKSPWDVTGPQRNRKKEREGSVYWKTHNAICLCTLDLWHFFMIFF